MLNSAGSNAMLEILSLCLESVVESHASGFFGPFLFLFFWFSDFRLLRRLDPTHTTFHRGVRHNQHQQEPECCYSSKQSNQPGPDHMAPSRMSVTPWAPLPDRCSEPAGPVVDDARGPAYVGAELDGWHASSVPGWWSPSTKHDNNIGWRPSTKSPSPTKSIAPSLPVRSPWLSCVSDHRRPPFHCPKRGYPVGLLSRPVEAHRCWH
ncbi:hypothetical protein BO78DRAFT_206223 [Aspergillus sclerotiicarbonarius CBS 121057]|uniref:Uncharacterized protein n=1 Tax=Aspergillus sclerotiicarbonarius (strain CBS 121057 / IBT 28362) TaxID=1448318 RepID=A0A319DZG4_ASPSB|nr:hypothetical protein BO78DRAFT_206223 [Aspergillus sclerotiicarbonarius CBS 121057]